MPDATVDGSSTAQLDAEAGVHGDGATPGRPSARSGVYVVDRGEDILVYVPVGEDFPNSEVVAGGTRGGGPLFQEPIDVAVDAEANLAYVLEASGTVLRADLATGDRTVASGDTVGAGPSLAGGVALATSLDGARLWVLGSWGLVAVDPSAGDRELVWEPPAELKQAGFEPVEFDVGTGEKVVIVDQGQIALVEASLADGATTPLSGGGPLWPSGGSLGSGPPLVGAVALALHAGGGFVLGSREILQVDLNTGHRSLASGSVDSMVVGEGLGFVEPRDFVIRSDGLQAFVLDGRVNTGELWRVALPSGDRSILQVQDAWDGSGKSLLSDPTGVALVP